MTCCHTSSALKARVFCSAAVFLLCNLLVYPRLHPGDDSLIVESRPLLHTYVEIKAYGDNASQAVEAAFAEMARVNDLLNNYDPHSEVSSINDRAGGKAVALHPETWDALELALRFGRLSGGALDITIGPLLKLWGFGKEEPGLAGGDPDAQALQKARSLVDYRALKLGSSKSASGMVVYKACLEKNGMWIDVGSFSKGYCADRGMAVLKERGIQNALLAAGGTICGMGRKPDGTLWKVGIRHPRKDDFMTFIYLQDASVSTSGDYETYYTKKGRRRGHIIDPRTGSPVERMQSVTVLAKTGGESDALSTTLFVLGPDAGIKLVDSLPGASALLVSAQGDIAMSASWPQKTVVY